MSNHSRLNKITITWLSYSGFILVLLILFTFTGKFKEFNSEVWTWYSGALVPTLSVIIIYYFDEKKIKSPIMILNQSISYTLALTISLVYLTTLLLVLFIEPIVDTSMTAIMGKIGLPINLVQGLIIASVVKLYE